eukprot:6459396-Amphidinium_carterae.1
MVHLLTIAKNELKKGPQSRVPLTSINASAASCTGASLDGRRISGTNANVEKFGKFNHVEHGVAEFCPTQSSLRFLAVSTLNAGALYIGGLTSKL